MILALCFDDVLGFEVGLALLEVEPALLLDEGVPVAVLVAFSEVELPHPPSHATQITAADTLSARTVPPVVLISDYKHRSL